MTRQLKGLFLNTPKAVCSIYESGKMAYECLVLSEKYQLDYQELSKTNRDINTDYDFYVFNYHWVTMGWLDTQFIKKLPGFKATIVLEVSINDPFACVSPNDFDAYIVLDPTCKHAQHNVYAFPRPIYIPEHSITPYESGKIPVIGTFGLSATDKGFDEVIKAVNEEFDEALIRINVPKADYIPSIDFENFIENIKNIQKKEEIKLEITRHYFNNDELINWCAQNTLNVFLYNRRVGNGLSATTDQAIASGRPLLVSTNPTFRHIHSYIKPYPYLSLKESIELTAPLVHKIQEDWKPLNFALRFEEVLQKNNIQPLKMSNGKKIKMRTINILDKVIRKLQFPDFIPPVILKMRSELIKKKNPGHISLNPFVHPALKSYSQFQEDLLIDMLLNNQQNGFYVDVGANDPFSGSNTHRFYSRGWSGINIEPNLDAYNKIAENRPDEINLNVAISENTGEITFYLIGNDSSISTVDYSQATKMAKWLNLKITPTSVKTMPLSEVFDTYLDKKHIDFMSVDVEGHDLAVLKSNNWDKYRPTFVLVESNIETRDIILFMDRQNYLYIFSNRINALFIDKMANNKNIIWN
nr:FkbM family methyltransferase [uncultured Methanolobus sp.]